MNKNTITPTACLNDKQLEVYLEKLIEKQNVKELITRSEAFETRRVETIVRERDWAAWRLHQLRDAIKTIRELL